GEDCHQAKSRIPSIDQVPSLLLSLGVRAPSLPQCEREFYRQAEARMHQNKREARTRRPALNDAFYRLNVHDPTVKGTPQGPIEGCGVPPEPASPAKRNQLARQQGS